jgi:hypothetical protein
MLHAQIAVLKIFLSKKKTHHMTKTEKRKLNKIFLGGVRCSEVMTNCYATLIEDNIVLCPNLEYLGMEYVHISMDIILKDCLSKIDTCDEVIFYVYNYIDMGDTFLYKELSHCIATDKKYTINLLSK